jgi:hypothetical protein
MQRIGATIPEAIHTFDLLHYRWGVACPQSIDPACKREIDDPAHRLPLY